MIVVQESNTRVVTFSSTWLVRTIVFINVCGIKMELSFDDSASHRL